MSEHDDVVNDLVYKPKVEEKQEPPKSSASHGAKRHVTDTKTSVVEDRSDKQVHSLKLVEGRTSELVKKLDKNKPANNLNKVVFKAP